MHRQKILTLLVCLMSINSAIGQVEKKTNKLVLKETKDYLLNKDSLSSKQWRQYKRHQEDVDNAILELFAIDTLEVNRLMDSMFNDIFYSIDSSDFSDSLRANVADSLIGGVNETDPVFNGSISKGIGATDTAYWNGKLDSYTEIDPVFDASVAKGITAIDTAYWNSKLDSSSIQNFIEHYTKYVDGEKETILINHICNSFDDETVKKIRNRIDSLASANYEIPDDKFTQLNIVASEKQVREPSEVLKDNLNVRELTKVFGKALGLTGKDGHMFKVGDDVLTFYSNGRYFVKDSKPEKKGDWKIANGGIVIDGKQYGGVLSH